MSFGTYARKVADPSLPYGRRVNALGGCVQLYRPIGYRATFAYLNHVAGNLRHDEHALLRALEALSASRDLWLNDVHAYADRRRAAKRSGRRSPGKAMSNPKEPNRWYGDVRQAAFFTLGFLLRKRDRIARADTDVVRLAVGVVESGNRLTPSDLEQLDVLLRRCERLRDVSGSPHIDRPNWHKAVESLWILHQLSCAAA